MFAIEESDRFAETIIPACDGILKTGGLIGISNKFEQFVPSEVHAVNQQKYKDRLEQIQKNTDLHEKIRALANTVESFATSFMKGIADEQVIFEAVGPVYCEIIEDFYFFYCHYRRSNPENLAKILPYQNTVNLYCIWKKRIEKIGLETNRKDLAKKTIDLDEEIKDATIKSSPIRPLGTF